MERERSESLERDYGMEENIKWIREFCAKYNVHTFSGIFGAIEGRLRAAETLNIGKVFSAGDVLKLLDFVWDALEKERYAND